MQSNPARILVTLISIAAIVGLFVVLSDGDGDDLDGTPATERTVPGEPPADPGTEPRARPDRRPEIATIRVLGGEPRGEVERLEYSRGDQVRFRVVSDVADEVHVHGYDVYADLEPGEPATVSFDADIDGIFEVELHSTHAQIAELRINP